MHGVTITELIEKMNLRNSTPQIDTDKIVLTHPVSYTHLPRSCPSALVRPLRNTWQALNLSLIHI